MKKIIFLSVLLIGAGVQAKSSATLSSLDQQNLVLAVQRGNWEPGVKSIITKKNINALITPSGWSTFLYAAYKGRTKIMTGLYGISKGCVRHTTPAGGTALMEAARSGQIKAMQWFETNNLLGTYLNKKDSLKNSPLTQAIVFNQYQAAEWLLEKGAKIDKRSIKAAGSSRRMLSLLKKYDKKIKTKKKKSGK